MKIYGPQRESVAGFALHFFRLSLRPCHAETNGFEAGKECHGRNETIARRQISRSQLLNQAAKKQNYVIRQMIDS